MADIKAIETVYKGYRCRSRLEARWLVYLDALGIPYEYEPEGFDLPKTGRYLPDVWLPEQKAWLEIKPLFEKHAKRYYFAGKISRNDWRHTIVSCLGNSEHNEWLPDDEHVISSSAVYVGPFFCSLGHGQSHGQNTHGQGDMESYDHVAFAEDWPEDLELKGDILARNQLITRERTGLAHKCMDAIDRCDVVFAWIDSLECFGSLVELGYAKAKGKQVWISTDLNDADLSGIWFLLNVANKWEWCVSPQESFEKWAINDRSMVKAKSRCADLAKTTRHEVCLVEGQPWPGECFYTWFNLWGHQSHASFGVPYFTNAAKHRFDKAATAARSARFEHGEQPRI